MTDKTPEIEISAEDVKEAIRQEPHLAPIYQAVLKHNVCLLYQRQSLDAFAVPPRQPWIVFVQDDPKPGGLSQGPEGFDIVSLEAVIRETAFAGIQASDPIAELYARVAHEAVVNESNTILIETWLTYETQWTDFIRKTNPDIKIMRGTVPSGRA